VFIAIVAHYVIKSGQLGMLFADLMHADSQCKNVIEELLIDFCQLEGEHCRANMAEATWDILTHFGIENRVGHKCLDIKLC
jgi:hypothetical protein